MRLIDADAVTNQIKDATDELEDEFPTDEQARLESKTDKVKVFKVINGVYVEG